MPTRNSQKNRDSRQRSTGTRQRSIRQSSKKKSSRNLAWEQLDDERLMDWRICDLKLQIESSWLQSKIEKLYVELADRGITFKPHIWLSDDWYSPDGIPGIAVPFYLAHPRLRALERRQMLEVEGGTVQWCLQILRHEAGHALDTAYRLHRRQSYREVFGNYNDPYPDYYRPKPNSKRYVLHLEPWYAQSHPAEDFAETFAVWLKPKSRWRTDYQGWPALKKVEYIDQLMTDVSGKPVKQKSRAKVDPVNRIRKTLGEHYRQRHARYGVDCPKSFDHDLRKLFPENKRSRGRDRSAANFLQSNRPELARVVAQWTGEYRYNVNQVLREMIERCRELNLRVSGNEMELKQKALVMLTVQTMRYLHGGHHRVAL